MSLSNTQKMSILELEEYSDKQKRAMARVLDTLDRIDKRTVSHYSNKRAHERKVYRGIVLVSFPNEDQTAEEIVKSVKVCSRSISQSGLSFVYPFRIFQNEILVGVPVSNDQTTWFRSEIVRQKEIQEEQFWEYGVKFLGKAIV